MRMGEDPTTLDFQNTYSAFRLFTGLATTALTAW